MTSPEGNGQTSLPSTNCWQPVMQQEPVRMHVPQSSPVPNEHSRSVPFTIRCFLIIISEKHHTQKHVVSQASSSGYAVPWLTTANPTHHFPVATVWWSKATRKEQKIPMLKIQAALSAHYHYVVASTPNTKRITYQKRNETYPMYSRTYSHTNVHTLNRPSMAVTRIKTLIAC